MFCVSILRVALLLPKRSRIVRLWENAVKIDSHRYCRCALAGKLRGLRIFVQFPPVLGRSHPTVTLKTAGVEPSVMSQARWWDGQRDGLDAVENGKGPGYNQL